MNIIRPCVLTFEKQNYSLANLFSFASKCLMVQDIRLNLFPGLKMSKSVNFGMAIAKDKLWSDLL